MVSCETYMQRSFGHVTRNQLAICSGDHSRRSLAATMRRSGPFDDSLHALGRNAACRARHLAAAARYLVRPWLRATSRDTVDGARLNRRAMARSDSSALSPLEISSHSTSVNAPVRRL